MGGCGAWEVAGEVEESGAGGAVSAEGGCAVCVYVG